MELIYAVEALLRAVEGIKGINAFGSFWELINAVEALLIVLKYPKQF